MIAPFWGAMLDCPRPRELAAFYQRICGGELAVDEESFSELRLESVSLGFQRDLNYRAPTWPEPRVGQQCHLDFRIEDLDAGEAAAIEAGATKASLQPDPTVFRVLLDPAGHPFCLTTWGTPAGPDSSR